MFKKINRYIYLTLIIGIVISLIGCSKNYEDDDVKYLKGAALHKMQENINKKDEIVVIDIRSEVDYQSGHVKHSINIPRENLKEGLDYIEENKEDPIILYGNTAKEAEDAGMILVKAGFPDVSNADGITEYEYDKYKYANVFPSYILERIGKEDSLIIDARDEEIYRDGHIEGAINIPSDGYLENKYKLPKDKNADIVTYCFKGNNSSILAQILVEEGYTNVHNQLYGTMEYEYDLVK